MKENKFPNTRKPSYQRVCREFRNLRGQHKQAGVGGGVGADPQYMHLTTIPSGEVAQMLASTTSEQGLGAEQGGAGCMLRVRTRPECPEDNLRELT